MTIFSLNNTSAPTSSSSFSNMKIFGTMNSSPFGGKERTTPLIQSSGFGKSAFGSNQKGSRTSSYIATPEICDTLLRGGNMQSICGMQTYKDKSHEELRFEDYQLGDKGTLDFNAVMHATSGQTQNISPGSSTLLTFEKNSNFGKSAFSINHKGSRTASFIATPEIATPEIGADGAKIQSICGMQTYKDKSQEELRFEDYQLGDKGQKCGAPQSTLCLNCVKQSLPTPPGIFNVSSTPLVASQNTLSVSECNLSHLYVCHLLSVINHIKLTSWSIKLVKHFYCDVVHLFLLLLKPLFFGPLQPEITPKVGATLATTNTCHRSTGASFSEIGQGIGQQP